VSEGRYPVQGRADRDLDERAYFYATKASSDVGHRFLRAAHDTFALLATQPNLGWHSHLTHPALKHLRVFRVRGFERILVLYPPLVMASKSFVSFTDQGTYKRACPPKNSFKTAGRLAAAQDLRHRFLAISHIAGDQLRE
jgi:hypothetical protein